MDLRRLNQLYEEHWRLIYHAGQAPSVALLVRMRMLTALRDSFPQPQVWTGYGFGIAEQILETAADSALALDRAQFRELGDLIRYAEGRGNRLGEKTREWSERTQRVTADLESAYQGGSRPPDGVFDWIAVPVVWELFGQPTLVEFEDLSTVGVQWLRIDLEHVTDLSLIGRGSTSTWGEETDLPASSTPISVATRIRGPVDHEVANYLSKIVDRLEQLAPGSEQSSAASIDHLLAHVHLYPSFRLSGFSVGLPFLLQMLMARQGTRPARSSIGWSKPVGASGVLQGHNFVEVSHLEAKLFAWHRAKVSAAFLPECQHALARELVERHSLQLSVVGIESAEEAALLARNSSSWTESRQRTVHEQLSQAWFWYLCSPVRGGLVGVATLLLIATLLAIFWPVPSSCDWPENGKLTVKNWAGVPIAWPKTGHWPGPGVGLQGAKYWDVLASSGSFLPRVLVVWGTHSEKHDVLALLDWRGNVLERWVSNEDPALGALDYGDMAWARFFTRETAAGHDVLLVPLRSVDGNLTVVRTFRTTPAGLEKRGYVWQRGHIEYFPAVDVNDDGQVDQLAMGWAQFLTDSGEERRDLPRGRRGRNVAYVIDLERLLEGDWGARDLLELPPLTSPGCADFGLSAGWSFPLDGMSNLDSSTCCGIRLTGPGQARFSCVGLDEGFLDYTLQIAPDFRTEVRDVQPTDQYVEELKSIGWTPDSVMVACSQLTSRVLWRTRNWQAAELVPF